MSSYHHLEDFLIDAKPLSLRATTGFLKRAESGNLRFVDGFLDDIRAHADIMRQREKLVAA